jgi:small conductance mechanosensitive channel
MSPNAVVGLEASGGGCDRRTDGGITLRVTRLLTPDGEVVVIPNDQVMQVTNLSRDWVRAVVDVPLAVGVESRGPTSCCARSGRPPSRTRS